MNCERTRTRLENLIVDGGSMMDLETESHLADCVACRQWYMEELEIVSALAVLDPLPVPVGFTAQVLGQLPAAVPDRPRRHRRAWWAAAWEALQRGLSGLTERRRLAPALAVAVSLILVLGLWLGWQGPSLPVTPGAATGNSGWLIGGIVGAGVLALLAAIFLRGR